MSLVVRFIEKVLLDSTGFVQLRHSLDAGGFYYCFNSLMTHVACFVAAALSSAYSMGSAPGNNGHSEGGGNRTGANHTSTTANGAAAEYAGANSSKIDDYTLFATIGTLSAAWAIAFRR